MNYSCEWPPEHFGRPFPLNRFVTLWRLFFPHGFTKHRGKDGSRSPSAGLPAVYVPLQHLLTRLSVSSILLITRLVLLEQKVLFVGSSAAWVQAWRSSLVDWWLDGVTMGLGGYILQDTMLRIVTIQPVAKGIQLPTRDFWVFSTGCHPSSNKGRIFWEPTWGCKLTSRTGGVADLGLRSVFHDPLLPSGLGSLLQPPAALHGLPADAAALPLRVPSGDHFEGKRCRVPGPVE